MKKKFDLHETITNQIIESIEKGDIEKWVKSWTDTGTPKNFKRNKKYNGLNILLLWLAQEKESYRTSLWATFNQISALGGTVKKDEKGTRIVYTELKKYIKKDEKTGEEETKQYWFQKYYKVFNISQTDLDINNYVKPKKEFNKIEVAENFISNIDHKVNHGGDTACYIPNSDKIRMPEKADFFTPEDYYSTYIHELGHWTGHTDRLNRNLSNKSKQAYAFEELVAELTSAFTCAELGIEGKLQHKDYIASWLKVLKDDKKAIFKASSLAQKASEYLQEVSTEKLAIAV